MFTLTLSLALGFGEQSFKHLGSDTYQKREITHRKLDASMDLDLYLKLKATTFNNLEAKRRAEALMGQYEENIGYETYQQAREHKDLVVMKTKYEASMVAKWMTAPKNYPAYPWIDRVPHFYRWNGWNGWQIHQFYLSQAQKMVGTGCDPFWNDYRLGTRLWVFDRISQGVEHASVAKTEKEFNFLMGKLVAEIQADMEIMIREEDKWWSGQENPLRRPAKK